MKKTILILFTLAAIVLGMQAQKPMHVPAYPGVITRVQPNGDTLHVFLRGDEHKHFMMTVDGWQVKEDNKGRICYCKARTKRIDGEKKVVAIATRKLAHDVDQRTKCELRWLERHGIKAQ